MQDAEHLLRQISVCLIDNLSRNLVVSLCQCSGDIGLRVSIATSHHRQADSVFKIHRLHKTADSHRHRFLTQGIKMTGGTDAIDVVQREDFVVETFLHMPNQRLFGELAGAQPEDGSRNTLCSLYAFRMVMGHLSTFLCFLQHFLEIVEQPSHATHAHGRTIATAIVRCRIVALQPSPESSSIAYIRIAPTPVAQALLIATPMQDGIGNGDGTHRVVRKETLWREQIECSLRRSAKLKPRTDNISNDCSQHNTKMNDKKNLPPTIINAVSRGIEPRSNL